MRDTRWYMVLLILFVAIMGAGMSFACGRGAGSDDDIGDDDSGDDSGDDDTGDDDSGDDDSGGDWSCCLLDGSCQVLSVGACVAANGYRGDGASCSQNPCNWVAAIAYDHFGPPFRDGSASDQGWAEPWGKHEGAVAVNPAFDWTTGARGSEWNLYGTNEACETTFQVIEGAAGPGDGANFRVQVGSLRLYVLLPDNEWHRLEATDDHSLEGGWFGSSYEGLDSGFRWSVEDSIAWQTRASDAKILHGWIWQWPDGHRAIIPAETLAFYAVATMRLIPDEDPNVDLDAFTVYGSVGTDFYEHAEFRASKAVSGTTMPRLKRLTGRWRTFTALTWPVPKPGKSVPAFDFMDAIRSVPEPPEE